MTGHQPLLENTVKYQIHSTAHSIAVAFISRHENINWMKKDKDWLKPKQVKSILHSIMLMPSQE